MIDSELKNHSNECLLSDLSEFTDITNTAPFPDNCGIGIINGTEEISL